MIVLAIIILAILFINAFRSSKLGQTELTQITNEEMQKNQIQKNYPTITGTTSYTVQKVFLSKPTETVTGETDQLSGDLQYQDGALKGTVVVATGDLDSGESFRDQEIKKLLGDTIRAEVLENSINLGTTQELMVAISINETTKTVPFTIETMQGDEASITLKGSAELLMSDLGIVAPSTAGIYGVDDKFILQVTIVVPQNN